MTSFSVFGPSFSARFAPFEPPCAQAAGLESDRGAFTLGYAWYPEGAQALSGTPAPPPQVEQLFLEAEARAEIIFNFAAGAFDVAEFFFDFV